MWINWLLVTVDAGGSCERWQMHPQQKKKQPCSDWDQHWPVGDGASGVTYTSWRWWCWHTGSFETQHPASEKQEKQTRDTRRDETWTSTYMCAAAAGDIKYRQQVKHFRKSIIMTPRVHTSCQRTKARVQLNFEWRRILFHTETCCNKVISVCVLIMRVKVNECSF